MFLRREKVNVVQYLKGEQVIILQMGWWLKTKNISDVPGQISCCQCKYLVKDSDNEFTECQTPRKKFQWIDISPVNLQAFTKTLKRSISEAQKVQVDWLNNSESDSYDKNDMQKKVNAFVRLHEAMQEKSKTASYSEPIQILTLVPDKWSRMYCSEYFNILEYLVWTSHEIKKVGEILAKPAPKKGKAITTETLHLVTNVFEDDNFGR